jgi:hypothetical protein
MQAGVERIVEVSDRKQAELESLADEPERYGEALVALRKSTYTDQEDSCYYDPELKFYASQDGFQFSTGLARFVMSDALLSISNSYYGKQTYLARASLHRMMPMERERGAYGWNGHHDAWGKKVNAMILLSEISEEEQHMAYRRRSHRGYRGFQGLLDGSFTDEEAERRFPNSSRCGASVNPVTCSSSTPMASTAR